MPELPRPSKTWSWIGASIAAVAIATLAIFIRLHTTNSDNGASSVSSPTQSDVRSPSLPTAAFTATSSASSAAPPASPSSQVSKRPVLIEISAINQTDSTLQIRALIPTLTNTGICTVTLTKNQATVSRTAAVQPLANSSTCEGFDIPLSNLSSGTWQLRLVFENSNLIGSATKAITVN